MLDEDIGEESYNMRQRVRKFLYKTLGFLLKRKK